MARLILQRLTWRTATVIVFEGVLIASAIGLGVMFRLGEAPWQMPTMLMRILVMTLVCQICLYCRDLYEFRTFAEPSELLIRVLQATGATALVLAVLYLVLPALIVGHGVFVAAGILVVGLVTTWRLSVDWVSRRLAPRERLLLIGSSPSASELVADLRKRTERDIEVVGLIAHDSSAVRDDGMELLGTLEDLPAVIRARGVDRVVVNLADARGKLPMDKLLEMRLDGVRFDHLASVYERYTGRIAVEHLRPSWLIFSGGFTKSSARCAVKRAVDIVGSALALVLVLPIIGIVALVVRLTSPGPVLYRQQRVGQHGRVFTLRKFRSMRQDAEAATGAVYSAGASDSRLTPVGRMLRRTHLDELPQLVNILMGDMSLVGPRPERPEFVGELSRAIPFYRLRHVVRPGLTGWAQVNQDYAASTDDSIRKLQYDLFYIKHLALTLDVYVLLRTIKHVLQGRGV
jgi:sugar transferase (PEP-CTERM system associated)